MAGKRTLCRCCNAALIVPEQSVQEPLEELVPPPRSRRASESVRTLEEKPPNWDTPIPFSSPVPIVGVLLIALAASVLILGIYAIARDPAAASKPAPFTGSYSYATQPASPSKPEVKPLDGKPTVPSDREVILPDREVIVPKSANSKFLGGSIIPRNWMFARSSGENGTTIDLHDWTRGTFAASFPDRGRFGPDAKLTASPSGLFMAVAGSSEVAVYSSANPSDAIRKWRPYEGRRTLSLCALISDDRLLTLSDDSSYDLWAIPSGDYIRRVAALGPVKNRDLIDTAVSFERSLLAIRNDTKLEIFSLEDDAFGPMVTFEPTATLGSQVTQLLFTPDGQRIVAASTVEATDGRYDDRFEVFDLTARKRTGDWMLKSNRAGREPPSWVAGRDYLLANRADLERVTCYLLSDGKLRSTVETGELRKHAYFDASEQRVWFFDFQPGSRIYGFDLPLRAPLGIRKDPIWEYRSGVLELKKAGR